MTIKYSTYGYPIYEETISDEIEKRKEAIKLQQEIISANIQEIMDIVADYNNWVKNKGWTK